MPLQPLQKTQVDRNDPARISTLDTPALRAELAEALGLTARHLLYLAAVWVELERRGEDLSDLRRGIAIYLPAIAIGAVLPETIMAFAGQPRLLSTVSRLSVDQQRHLTAGGTVLVVERRGDEYTHRQVPIQSLPGKLTAQVFGDRTIRSEAEQIAYLLPPPPPPPTTNREPKRGKFRADRSKGVILLGRRQLAVADLLQALGDLKSTSVEDSASEEEESSVPIKLTAAEHRSLKQRALDGDTTQTKLIRNALRALGII